MKRQLQSVVFTLGAIDAAKDKGQRQPTIWTNPRDIDADSQALRVQPHILKRLKGCHRGCGRENNELYQSEGNGNYQEKSLHAFC